MTSLLRIVVAAIVAVACTYLAACGGASPASGYADELTEPAPASATRGSTLGDLPDGPTETRSTP
ncbi:hypothetical protein [Piscinibacter sp. HJYY11]|uniref:hypothetical protein n=1 Tax=Piscinibacter sp. HJYY11 TaxID=2801333 RepID=UPI00191F3E90|nr:hypothetical protein [Piscinibacter sp. HJYY11]MBL0730755.1 hypothetical protein [Piscinibacter sp. HJYY11]